MNVATDDASVPPPLLPVRCVSMLACAWLATRRLVPAQHIAYTLISYPEVHHVTTHVPQHVVWEREETRNDASEQSEEKEKTFNGVAGWQQGLVWQLNTRLFY